jgi:hypothetical protein
VDEQSVSRVKSAALLAGAALVLLVYLAWRSRRPPFGWGYGAVLLGPVALGLLLLAAGRPRAARWVGLASLAGLALLWLAVQVSFWFWSD